MSQLYRCQRCTQIINDLDVPAVYRLSMGDANGGTLQLDDVAKAAMHPLALALLEYNRLYEVCAGCLSAILLDPQAEANRLNAAIAART